MAVRPAIIPNLRYADAPKAIAFLRDGFGFVVHAVHADPRDPEVIAHAQLLFDGQMVMLSSAQPSEFADAAPMLTVAQAGGNTQSLYIVLDDVDGHCARARAGGADIFMEPKDTDYGGRGYAARDPEGNVWSFGSYDPFA
ncbi:MAG TPA: VOC family protein [Sphingomonas sp.]|nr:VOC family protein [Sphingomonas sp.]